MIGTVCRGCKTLAEIAYVDSLGIEYCATCAKDVEPPGDVLALQYLIANPPFRSGDRVECRTGAEIYEGVGTVEQTSFDIEHGGTVVYPAFLVTIDEPANEHSPAQGWFTEVCLRKVGE